MDLIIAADVVYDDTATEAFLSCVASIMQYRRAQSDLQSSGILQHRCTAKPQTT